MHTQVCAVVGVGPGISSAVAKRFAKEGFAVALIARSQEHMTSVEQEIKSSGKVAISVKADTTKEDEVKNAFAQIKNNLGPVSVLVYNAGAFKRFVFHA